MPRLENRILIHTLLLIGTANAQAGGSLPPGGGAISFNSHTDVKIAHAVLATSVWVILMPIGAILLRLGIKSPMMVRIHAIWQVCSYFIFVAGVGLGIWLAKTFSTSGTWKSVHPRIGLAVFGAATLQPFLGYIHHRIFKRRETGHSTKPPGGTVPGYIHRWLGRAIIILGMINGGLGLQLAGGFPTQAHNKTRKAIIAYCVVVGVMGLAYLTIAALFEVRRDRPRDDESEEPVQPAAKQQ